jgi:hypothetical protein
MTFNEAHQIIDQYKDQPDGYYVHFEHKEGVILRSDYIPSGYGEGLFDTFKDAQEFAVRFAKATVGQCVNFYITDENHRGIDSYDVRWRIENR